MENLNLGHSGLKKTQPSAQTIHHLQLTKAIHLNFGTCTFCKGWEKVYECLNNNHHGAGESHNGGQRETKMLM